MILEADKKIILDKLSQGLPICEHPYLALSNELGIKEDDLLDFINDSLESGSIKRMGCVLNHHKLGYTANAMVVWNVPDERVNELGETLGEQSKVTLCYQRPRVEKQWPFNLFTMIHGKNRKDVLNYLDSMVEKNKLTNIQKAVLFSTKKFKQTGARYNDSSKT